MLITLKSVLVPALVLVAFASSTASAGCDYDVKDKDLQVAMPMSEDKIRLLIREAKQKVSNSVEEASKYEARASK